MSSEVYFWGVNSFTSKLISWFSIIFTLSFPGVLLHRKVFLWLLFYVPFAMFFYACRKHQSTYQYFNVHFQVKWSLAVIKNNKFISILVAATVYQVFFLIIPHTVAFFFNFSFRRSKPGLSKKKYLVLKYGCDCLKLEGAISVILTDSLA